MELDERLRLLADEVPAPPPGDAAATLRRGVGRRRFRHGVGVAAVIALVGLAGVGVSVLTDGPGGLDISEQPHMTSPPASDEAPIVTRPPTMTLSDRDPFPWAVGVSATDDGRWCATTVRGSTDLPDPVGQPCTDLLTVPERDEITWHGSQPERGDGATAQGLSWGLVRAATDTVYVEFTDGTRRQAPQASSDSLRDVALWVIAYEDTDIQAIEAAGDGFDIGIVVLDGFDTSDALLLAGLLAAAVAAASLVLWAWKRRSNG